MSKLLFLLAITANVILIVSSTETIVTSSSSSSNSYSSSSSSAANSSYTYSETLETCDDDGNDDNNNNNNDGDSSTTSEAPTTVNTQDAETRLVKGSTSFTGKFLYQVLKNSLDNTISSPFSVLIPLSELALYSNGNSYSQLINALNLKNNAEIRSVFPALIESLNSQKNVVFSLAAKVYSNDKYELSDNFLSDTKNVFDAEAEAISFDNTVQAANTINTWVADKTNDRITDLVSSEMFDANTRLVLTNAIYFKGNWIRQFNPNATTERDFHVNNNKIIQVKTMYQKGSFNYAESDTLDAKIIELPYKGGNFSFIAILPNKVEGILNLVETLQDSDAYGNAINSLSRQIVHVYLPSIEVRSSIDLTNVLKAVGITDIFDAATANLSGILKQPENLFVSAAIQKAFIVVNEVGSEAAAANAIIVGTTSAPINPPKIFDANHPFAFYITQGNIPFFSGVYIGN